MNADTQRYGGRHNGFNTGMAHRWVIALLIGVCTDLAASPATLTLGPGGVYSGPVPVNLPIPLARRSAETRSSR